MKHYYGEQFDSADYTTTEILKRFPDDAAQFLEERAKSWQADPKYYRVVIQHEIEELQSLLK